MQREVGEAFEVDDVANGFESSREVKEDEDSDFIRVRSDEEVIGDLHQRGPCDDVFCMLTEEVHRTQGWTDADGAGKF